jgi:tRNA 2-thiouridine synthesizing protein A
MSAEGGPRVVALDLSGLKCPLPVLRARKALRRMAPGERLDVTCTDPMSAIDIPNMVRESGDRLLEARTQTATLFFRIEKATR